MSLARFTHPFHITIHRKASTKLREFALQPGGNHATYRKNLEQIVQPTSVRAVALGAEVPIDFDDMAVGGHLVRLPNLQGYSIYKRGCTFRQKKGSYLRVQLEVGDRAPRLGHRLRGEGHSRPGGRLGRRPRRGSRHQGVRRLGTRASRSVGVAIVLVPHSAAIAL